MTRITNTLRQQTSVLILLLALCLNLFAIQPLVAEEEKKHASPSGKELFIQHKCVRCHTIGRGRFVGPDLFGVENRYSREEIVKWIENPQLIYQSRGKVPINEGYPQMPPLNVAPAVAEKIADYLLSVKTSREATSKGIIKGTAINKTLGEKAPDVEVFLNFFMGDKPTAQRSVKTDKNGNFMFDDLPWDRSYSITLEYGGARYSTDKMVFSPGMDNIEIDLPIYEPTSSDENIEVPESHMIAKIIEDTISIADFSVYANSDNTVYIGDKVLEDGRKETLKFSTPDNARDFKLIHGISLNSTVGTDIGFSDTSSVIPGERRVVYTYSLSLESGDTYVEKVIDYPTGHFLLLISGFEGTVSVKGLSTGEPVIIDNQNFLKWSGTELKPGHRIQIEFKKQKWLNIVGEGENYLQFGALGLLFLIILSAILFSNLAKPKILN